MLWAVLQEPVCAIFKIFPTPMPRSSSERSQTGPGVLEPSAAGRFEWLVYFSLPGRETDSPLGWVSLRISERTPTIAEIGYSVVREQRGRGIATEAVAALIGEGFGSARLRCVRAYCVPRNVSSRTVLTRNGFEDDGLLPHGATVQGQPVNVIAYSLQRERWESLRATSSSSAI